MKYQISERGPFKPFWDLLEGDRIVIRCNMLGQPIGNGGYCSVGVKDWREVKKNNAETIIQFVQVSSILQDIILSI